MPWPLRSGSLALALHSPPKSYLELQGNVLTQARKALPEEHHITSHDAPGCLLGYTA